MGLVAVGIASIGVVILSPGVPVALAVVAWGVAGLGMGLAYPGCTLTALADAGSGQEGFASASLQVAETVGIAAGAGGAGALLALAVHLDSGLPQGLTWAFWLATSVALVGLAPAARLVSGGKSGLERQSEAYGQPTAAADCDQRYSSPRPNSDRVAPEHR